MNEWIVTITVITAAILQLIDTSIINVALSETSGNLGSTLEDRRRRAGGRRLPHLLAQHGAVQRPAGFLFSAW